MDPLTTKGLFKPLQALFKCTLMRIQRDWNCS